MDQRSNKRGPGWPVTPTKADQNTQTCNRTGCSGRTKDSQNMRIGSSEKAKFSNPSFRSSVGNEITRIPLGRSSITTSAKKPYLDSKGKLPSPSASSRSSSVGSFNRCNGDGLRSLKCNSISDVVPVGKKTMTRRRSLQGESSSSRGVRKTTSLTGVCDRRSGGNGSSVRERDVGISETRNSELSSGVGHGSLSVRFSASGLRSYGTSSNGGNENPSDTMGFGSEEAGFLTRLMDDDVPRGYNMGGIAEMLLALERIEQKEELTHEDLLALETNLFFGGLNLYDQHRDLRLDIDNMSYEELLALEDEMGTVSTALPEDALSKCLRRSIYQATPSKAHITGSTPSKVQITGSCEDEDDIKCSICQEEYVAGDEIGKLVECQHGYHIRCINKWLQLKNWCPFCKASAAQSKQTSSSL